VDQFVPYTVALTCGLQINVKTPNRQVNLKFSFVELWEWRYRATLSLVSLEWGWSIRYTD
jgi:hypothetical protein